MLVAWVGYSPGAYMNTSATTGNCDHCNSRFLVACAVHCDVPITTKTT